MAKKLFRKLLFQSIFQLRGFQGIGTIIIITLNFNNNKCYINKCRCNSSHQKQNISHCQHLHELFDCFSMRFCQALINNSKPEFNKCNFYTSVPRCKS